MNIASSAAPRGQAPRRSSRRCSRLSWSSSACN